MDALPWRISVGQSGWARCPYLVEVVGADNVLGQIRAAERIRCWSAIISQGHDALPRRAPARPQRRRQTACLITVKDLDVILEPGDALSFRPSGSTTARCVVCVDGSLSLAASFSCSSTGALGMTLASSWRWDRWYSNTSPPRYRAGVASRAWRVDETIASLARAISRQVEILTLFAHQITKRRPLNGHARSISTFFPAARRRRGNQPVCRVHGDDVADARPPSSAPGTDIATPSSRRRIDGVEVDERDSGQTRTGPGQASAARASSAGPGRADAAEAPRRSWTTRRRRLAVHAPRYAPLDEWRGAPGQRGAAAWRQRRRAASRRARRTNRGSARCGVGRAPQIDGRRAPHACRAGLRRAAAPPRRGRCCWVTSKDDHCDSAAIEAEENGDGRRRPTETFMKMVSAAPAASRSTPEDRRASTPAASALPRLPS